MLETSLALSPKGLAFPLGAWSAILFSLKEPEVTGLSLNIFPQTNLEAEACSNFKKSNEMLPCVIG